MASRRAAGADRSEDPAPARPWRGPRPLAARRRTLPPRSGPLPMRGGRMPRPSPAGRAPARNRGGGSRSAGQAGVERGTRSRRTIHGSPPCRRPVVPVSGPHPWKVRATRLPSRASAPRHCPRPSLGARAAGSRFPARPRAEAVFPRPRGLTPGRAVSRTCRPRKQADGRSARGTHPGGAHVEPDPSPRPRGAVRRAGGTDRPRAGRSPAGCPRARHLRTRRPGAGTPREDGATPPRSGGPSPVRGPQCPGPERGGPYVRSRRDPRRTAPTGRTGGAGGAGRADRRPRHRRRWPRAPANGRYAAGLTPHRAAPDGSPRTRRGLPP